MTQQALPLDQATFENPFVDELRGEVSGNRGSRQVPGYCYSRVAPTPVADPHLLAWSDELGAFLGLARPAERGPAVAALAGNLVTASMKPFAARYGGHQFGKGGRVSWLSYVEGKHFHAPNIRRRSSWLSVWPK